MLDYFKTILKKVSFDAFLFERELKKAIKSLINEQLEELKAWCYKHFGDQYNDILLRHFPA